MSKFKVGIIGSGPSGLILAFYLNKLGIDFLVFEKAKEIGDSWRKMPDHMSLVSLWFTNCLTKDFLCDYLKYKVTSKNELIYHLEKISNNFYSKIQFDTNVENIVQLGSKVELFFRGRAEYFDLVVDCTGYFSNPEFPQVFKSSSIKTIHYNDFRNKEAWKNYKNILIVGKRLSAGQVLIELDKNNCHNFYISTRSVIKFGAHPILFNLFLRYFYYIENFLIKIGLGKEVKMDVKMDYKAKKIVRNKAKVLGLVKDISNGQVCFDDNQRLNIDLIILATGYKRNCPNSLDSKFNDPINDRIFYLGVDNLKTFRSRFLRGIREDAYELASYILDLATHY